MTNARTCVLMCQPSASKAIECDIKPATISTTIIAAVIPITMRVAVPHAKNPARNRASYENASDQCDACRVKIARSHKNGQRALLFSGLKMWYAILSPRPGRAGAGPLSEMKDDRALRHPKGWCHERRDNCMCVPIETCSRRWRLETYSRA